MFGRRKIITKKAFTIFELYEFMEQHWDKERDGAYSVGRLTAMSRSDYIMLPGTDRYLVYVFPRPAKGLYRRNSIIISLAYTDSGRYDTVSNDTSVKSILLGAFTFNRTALEENIHKDPAKKALRKYASTMKRLLAEAGYTDR